MSVSILYNYYAERLVPYRSAIIKRNDYIPVIRTLMDYFYLTGDIPYTYKQVAGKFIVTPYDSMNELITSMSDIITNIKQGEFPSNVIQNKNVKFITFYDTIRQLIPKLRSTLEELYTILIDVILNDDINGIHLNRLHLEVNKVLQTLIQFVILKEL